VFSPDGKRLASAGKVWDAETGEVLCSLQGAPRRVVFSPDGKRLVGAAPGGTRVKVWDAETGQELLSLKGTDGPDGADFAKIAFSPEGHRLAVFSPDDGKMKIYDATPLPEAGVK
jgi:WD40 repeat protein